MRGATRTGGTAAGVGDAFGQPCVSARAKLEAITLGLLEARPSRSPQVVEKLLTDRSTVESHARTIGAHSAKLAALHDGFGRHSKGGAPHEAGSPRQDQKATREPRGSSERSPRHRNEMEVEDSPVKDDDYSDVDSDAYDDDFGEAEAPPDPIATPVADNYDDEDFGADDRGYDAKREDLSLIHI